MHISFWYIVILAFSILLSHAVIVNVIEKSLQTTEKRKNNAEWRFGIYRSNGI